MLKAIIVVLIIVVAVAATQQEAYYQEAFQHWLAKYNRPYVAANNNNEFMKRYTIFKNNLQYIESHNRQSNTTYTMGLNFSADMEWEEFVEYYKMNQVNVHAAQYCSATQGRSSPLKSKISTQAPSSVDWRKSGVVTPVKNQRNCGSCWTFSTTGALEGYLAQKSGVLVSLSEQQLVDCAKYTNNGCSGGLPSSAYTWLANNGGIQPDISYPYEGIDNKCRFDQSQVIVNVKTSNNITEGDEAEMGRVVGNLGVVSIAYQVVQDFRFYTGGVYSSSSCKSGPMDVNHAVLIVGYGVDSNGVQYWIVKVCVYT
jgi:cathepsin H